MMSEFIEKKKKNKFTDYISWFYWLQFRVVQISLDSSMAMMVTVPLFQFIDLLLVCFRQGLTMQP